MNNQAPCGLKLCSTLQHQAPCERVGCKSDHRERTQQGAIGDPIRDGLCFATQSVPDGAISAVKHAIEDTVVLLGVGVDIGQRRPDSHGCRRGSRPRRRWYPVRR